MMNQMRSGSDIEAAMMEAFNKKDPAGEKKDSFVMVGQNTSPVMYDEQRSREFVVYTMPDGEQVEVFGNWNEYAVGEGEEPGSYIIADEDYPIVKNAQGEYELDEMSFELKMGGGDATQQMASQAQGGPSASGVEDLLERLTGY